MTVSRRACRGAFLSALLAITAAGCVTARPTRTHTGGLDIPADARAASEPDEWYRFDARSVAGVEGAPEYARLLPPPEFPEGDPIDWSSWDPIDDTPLEALPEGNPDLSDDPGEGDHVDAAWGPGDALKSPSASTTLPASSRKKKIPSLGALIVRSASHWVGLRSLRKVTSRVPDDCSGLVRLAYQRAGLDPLGADGRRGDNAVTTIWRRAYRLGALKRSAPRPGDLVFFRNTWDRNGDGRRDDGLTHVGVVEKVAADGTVTFIHRASHGITREHLHPQRPGVHTDDRGRVLNDFLRRPDGTDGPRLTGELFAGFATASAFRRESLAARRAAGGNR